MIIDFVKSFYYELKSYLVPETLAYEVKGECKKCGKCCRYMYSYDTYTEKEFKIMQFLFPPYKRFYIKGRDECGNLIFACKYVQEDGLCGVYDKRLRMCKKYPVPKLKQPLSLHEGCGFYVKKKTFKEYL